jgi:hypothetical protein
MINYDIKLAFWRNSWIYRPHPESFFYLGLCKRKFQPSIVWIVCFFVEKATENRGKARDHCWVKCQSGMENSEMKAGKELNSSIRQEQVSQRLVRIPHVPPTPKASACLGVLLNTSPLSGIILLFGAWQTKFCLANRFLCCVYFFN